MTTEVLKCSRCEREGARKVAAKEYKWPLCPLCAYEQGKNDGIGEGMGAGFVFITILIAFVGTGAALCYKFMTK